MRRIVAENHAATNYLVLQSEVVHGSNRPIANGVGRRRLGQQKIGWRLPGQHPLVKRSRRYAFTFGVRNNPYRHTLRGSAQELFREPCPFETSPFRIG